MKSSYCAVYFFILYGWLDDGISWLVGWMNCVFHMDSYYLLVEQKVGWMTALYSWMDDELYMGSYQLTAGQFCSKYANDWLDGWLEDWTGWLDG